MDTQAAPAGKQTKGIKKLWIKFKASMKSEQSSPSKSSAATTTPKPVASESTTSAPVASKAITEPVPTSVQDTNTMATPSATKPEPEKKVEETKSAAQPILASEVIQVDDDDEDYDEKSPMPQMTSTVSSDKEATAMRYQRAQDVFKKYNLEMDPADWQQPNNSSVQRVEKKPRMRVRYNCHECKQTFGREKKCTNCTHSRCDSCVRYPPKKTGDKAKKSKKVEADLSTMTALTTGACHECKTTFDLGVTECANCNHEICSRCLKETVIASPATAPPPAQPMAVAAAS